MGPSLLALLVISASKSMGGTPGLPRLAPSSASSLDRNQDQMSEYGSESVRVVLMYAYDVWSLPPSIPPSLLLSLLPPLPPSPGLFVQAFMRYLCARHWRRTLVRL